MQIPEYTCSENQRSTIIHVIIRYLADNQINDCLSSIFTYNCQQMESVNVLIALITAGVSLAMGLIYLFTGLHKDADKADLIFGMMCISVFIFFILPPAGFIIIDKAPYPAQIIIKRLFNFLNGALFPWFIYLYSGYGRKRIPIFADFIYLVGYLIDGLYLERQ